MASHDNLACACDLVNVHVATRWAAMTHFCWPHGLVASNLLQAPARFEDCTERHAPSPKKRLDVVHLHCAHLCPQECTHHRLSIACIACILEGSDGELRARFQARKCLLEL